MIREDHAFVGRSNGRYLNSCGRCGKVPEAHPQVDPDAGRRNPRFEKSFLDEAERLAGLSTSGFTEEVQARLHAMEREKGADSYLELGLRRIVHEIELEGYDLGGWPTVGCLAARRDIQDDDARYEFMMILQEIASFGPRVKQLCERARELVP
jgi:hypothetical protein